MRQLDVIMEGTVRDAEHRDWSINNARVSIQRGATLQPLALQTVAEGFTKEDGHTFIVKMRPPLDIVKVLFYSPFHEPKPPMKLKSEGVAGGQTETNANEFFETKTRVHIRRCERRRFRYRSWRCEDRYPTERQRQNNIICIVFNPHGPV